jgi:hypothetical protein
MFAKRTKQSSRGDPPTDDGSQTEQSGSESHADAIERLEGELDKQRAANRTLQEALDAAKFKSETLEKSYAKQLGAARDKLASAQTELKEKEEILAGLGGPHEHTLRELNDALTVIKVLKKQLDQLRKHKPQGGGGLGLRQRTETTKARALLGDDAHGMIPAPGDNRGGTSGDDTGDGTINALIANASWEKKKPGVGTGQATATVDSVPEATRTEMLSPDLVFTARDKEDDDGR